MTACQKTLCQKTVCQIEVCHFTAQPLRYAVYHFKRPNSLCVISDFNKKSDYIDKIYIFEIRLTSRFQKCKNFQNRMVDSDFLPLWQHFANFWLMWKKIA